MTVHERFLESVSVELDFVLIPSERDAVERHLATCPSCQAEAAALRADARAIVDLPVARLDPVRAERILGITLVRTPRRPSLQLVLLGALLALLTLGALAIGSELLREAPRPPFVVVPPSVAPSIAPTSAPSGVPGWLVADIGAPGALPGRFTTVASSGSTYVAVGGQTCVSSGDVVTGCSADVYRSTDGRSWTRVDTAQASLGLGTAITLSGPSRGMIDVAGGGQGFVAIGYAGSDVLRPTLWMSVDGLIWDRLAQAPFDGAELTAVVNAGGRWVVAGAIVDGVAPRGATWWSDDGTTWNRAPDSVVFDVGGFIDTGETPGVGGIRALATDGSRIVGVGTVCDAEGRSCPAAIWTSDDGIRWDRKEGLDLSGEVGLVFGGFAVHGDGGFLVMGSSCPATGCVGIGLLSTDGRTWTEVSQAGLGEILAVAPIPGGYVVATPTKTLPPGLALFGSTDGRSWRSIDGIPTVENGVLAGVDLTPTPDGYVMVVVRYEVHDGPELSVIFDVRPGRT